MLAALLCRLGLHRHDERAVYHENGSRTETVLCGSCSLVFEQGLHGVDNDLLGRTADPLIEPVEASTYQEAWTAS